MYRGTFRREAPRIPGFTVDANGRTLRSGAAAAAATLRFVRRIFPAAHVAGKNNLSFFRLMAEIQGATPLGEPQAATLRFVRSIFPDVHAAGKNDFVFSALRRRSKGRGPLENPGRQALRYAAAGDRGEIWGHWPGEMRLL